MPQFQVADACSQLVHARVFKLGRLSQSCPPSLQAHPCPLFPYSSPYSPEHVQEEPNKVHVTVKHAEIPHVKNHEHLLRQRPVLLHSLQRLLHQICSQLAYCARTLHTHKVPRRPDVDRQPAEIIWEHVQVALPRCELLRYSRSRN